MSGILYVVATPIGNLEDLSFRAARILGEVDRIACEDTRQTRKLLDHFKISKPLVSYHDHNEAERSGEFVRDLECGKSIALVSDAGTPLISDPGYRLVQAAIAAGIVVVPIPGPVAFASALSASGLPTDEVRFCGFLPAKSGQRRRALEELREETATTIFYETPHRLLEALDEIDTVLGTRPIVVAREVTKLHEEFLRGTAAAIRADLGNRPGGVRGEITLLIGKATSAVSSDVPVEAAVAALEATGVARMDAIKQVARERGLPKREVYRIVEDAAG